MVALYTNKKMPATTIKKRIEAYCTAHGITIPAGFGRNTTSRYAIIRRDADIPKLVAKTWFKHEDIAYYIQITLNHELGDVFDLHVDILDFKDGHRLRYTGSNRLQVEDQFIQP
jgi:hypothetical protein